MHESWKALAMKIVISLGGRSVRLRKIYRAVERKTLLLLTITGDLGRLEVSLDLNVGQGVF